MPTASRRVDPSIGTCSTSSLAVPVSGPARRTLRRAQRQYRDLARRKDAERRSPEAGAAARIELGSRAMARQTGDDRLIRAHEVVERPDLSTVRVPGDLQVNAVLDSAVDLLWLMRQQQNGDTAVG